MFCGQPRGEVRISIHAPRTGSDVPYYDLADTYDISIHAPRTGSDGASLLGRCPALDISIHAPRTGSDMLVMRCMVDWLISIHAPRTGSDALEHPEERVKLISIHAPRTGSDTMRLAKHRPLDDFNPRSPHGERRRRLGRLD